MMAGLSMWWQQNQMKIYGAMAGLLVVTGIVGFFTGGSGIILLLQGLLKAMTAYFIADALVKVKSYFQQGLKEGWNGQIENSGQNFAKAIAIILSEFVLEYVLAKADGVIKRAVGALKKTKGTQKAGKLAKKVGKGAKKAMDAIPGVKKGRKAVVKNGKIVLTRIKKGTGKGVKKLGELREQLLKRMGFDKMWIERNGKYLELWASFNPKFRLGRKEVQANNNYSTKTRKELAEQGMTGKDMPYEWREIKKANGEVTYQVRKSNSRWYDAEYIGGKGSSPKVDEFLNNDAIPDKVKDAVRNRGKITGKNPQKPSSADIESHHIQPVDALIDNKVLQDAVENGFEFNSMKNRKNLKKYSTTRGLDDGVHASHPKYTEEIVNKIYKDFDAQFVDKGLYDPTKHAKPFAEAVSEVLESKLKKYCIDAKSPIKVNDLHTKIDVDKTYKEILGLFNKKLIN